MITRCFSTSFLGFEARLVRLKRSGGVGGGAQTPPPPHLQTPCSHYSHDGCQQVSFLGFEARLVLLKKTGGVGGGGAQPKHPAHMMGVNKFLGL